MRGPTRLPLHVAAAHPKIAPSVLRFLVDRGPASALQQRDSKLRVPLLLAASAGAHEHARILVEARPASARERNHEGRTPLHIAVAAKNDDDNDESGSASSDEWANGVAELARLFVDQWPESAHERDPTRDGRTPLHVAVASFARGGPALLRLLAERSPQSLRAPDYKGRLPLHLADGLESARILLECCPELARVQDRDGRLPAHAVIAAVSQTAAKLQQNGPAEGTEENIPPPEEWPLRVARLLVEAHPESLLAQDRKNGWVPLHAVLFDKRAPLDAVAFLIEAQPLALQIPDRVGRLPLHMWMTIEDGWYLEPEAVPRLNLGPAMLDMARMLVETCPDSLRVQDMFGQVPLFFLLGTREPPLDLARLLVEAWPGALLAQTHEGRVPLCALLSRSDAALDTVRYVVEAQPLALQSHDHEGRLPLHGWLSLKETSLGVTEVLVGTWPEALDVQDLEGSVPLHCLLEHCANRIVEVARYVIQRRPQALRVRDRQGRLPLHVWASRRIVSAELARLLVEPWPESLLVADHQGRLPLHVLLESSDAPSEVVELFVETRPLCLQIQDHAGRLPLHVWCSLPKPRKNVARFLVEAFPESLQVQDQQGWIPLFAALANRRSPPDLVQLLVEAWPPALQARDPFGLVPLQVAAAATAMYEKGDILYFLARQCPELFDFRRTEPPEGR
jgi:ankyrin repeat protein